jgi:hypothetical protein
VISPMEHHGDEDGLMVGIFHHQVQQWEVSRLAAWCKLEVIWAS